MLRVRAWAMLGAAAAVCVADWARACPSCASPLEENRQAFVDTTIFMTVVPLLMIGGLVFWIRRKAQHMEQAPEIEVPEKLLRDAGRFSKGR
jgi:hypothetical protein